MSVSSDQKLASNSTSQELAQKMGNQQKMQTLLKLKNYKLLVKLLMKNKSSRDNYPKLKYQGTIYHIGQNLALRGSDKHEYVGKLIKILNLADEEDQCISLVKIQWYYRKHELKNIPKEQLDCISENEVFKTHQYDYVEIESILGLATILKFEEYDSIESLNDYTYFMRAQYDGKCFQPQFKSWAKTCICRLPPNPDLKYILCDMCQEWCHLKCFGLTQDQANRIHNFACSKCRV